MILRLPGEAFYRDNLAFGSLHFSDGSQKTLACFAVFIALHLAATLPGNADQLTHPSVQGLLASMLRIPTLVKGSVGVSSDVDSAVSQIVKQNLDSKVQPVSALAWVSILRSLGSDVGADGLIAKYNDHPEVVAMEQSGGVGSIGIDKKKMQAGRWYSFRSVRLFKDSTFSNYGRRLILNTSLGSMLPVALID